MDADHQKSAFASKRGVPKCPFGELYVLHFQTDDFFKTKFCGKQVGENKSYPHDSLCSFCRSFIVVLSAILLQTS